MIPLANRKTKREVCSSLFAAPFWRLLAKIQKLSLSSRKLSLLFYQDPLNSLQYFISLSVNNVKLLPLAKLQTYISNIHALKLHVPRNFAKFKENTRKHMCFPVNFAKFLRTPFLTEHLWWLLLEYCKNYLKQILFTKSKLNDHLHWKIKSVKNFNPD